MKQNGFEEDPSSSGITQALYLEPAQTHPGSLPQFPLRGQARVDPGQEDEAPRLWSFGTPGGSQKPWRPESL